MDEASPSAGGFRSQPVVRLAQRDQNVGPHASRLYRQNTAGSRRRTQSLSTLSQNPSGGAGVCLIRKSTKTPPILINDLVATFARLFLVLVLLILTWSVYAADSSPLGLWKTMDDNTGQPSGL